MISFDELHLIAVIGHMEWLEVLMVAIKYIFHL